MRGTYEAFILVKVKDGRQFVCALNRKKPGKIAGEKLNLEQQKQYLDNNVIWN